VVLWARTENSTFAGTEMGEFGARHEIRVAEKNFCRFGVYSKTRRPGRFVWPGIEVCSSRGKPLDPANSIRKDGQFEYFRMGFLAVRFLKSAARRRSRSVHVSFGQKFRLGHVPAPPTPMMPPGRAHRAPRENTFSCDCLPPGWFEQPGVIKCVVGQFFLVKSDGKPRPRPENIFNRSAVRARGGDLSNINRLARANQSILPANRRRRGGKRKPDHHAPGPGRRMRSVDVRTSANDWYATIFTRLKPKNLVSF